MKRKLSLLPVFLIILVSCGKNAADFSREVDMPVSVMELKPELIEKCISVTGAVKPVKEATLKSQAAGKYKLLVNPATQKPFKLGDRVKEGQEIILLENPEYENSLRLSSLSLNLEISSQTHDKQRSLYEKGGVTLSELKQAEVNYINAKYAYEEALIKLEKMKTKAPFSGVIVDLPHYTPGVMIEAGLDLVKIMEYDKMIMEVNFSENAAAEVKPGLKARILNYMFPDQAAEGVVAQISPAINPETRSFKGGVIIDNSSLALKPGMYVKGEIIVNSADSAIVIPREIIQTRNQGNVVFVAENGFARERVVTLGLENSGKVQVTSGLKLNDRVIYKGFETLRDRTKIKIVQ